MSDRKAIEEAITAWRAKRAERLAADKVANKLKEKESELKSFILEAFKEEKWEGMLIDGRTTGLSTKLVPTVADKEKFMAYVRETGDLDLLQFRLSTGAVDERRSNGVVVPGTEYTEFYDLFDRKS